MVNAYGSQSFESKTNSFHFMYHIKNIDISNTFFCEIFIKMYTHAFFPRIHSITEAFFVICWTLKKILGKTHM